MFLPKHGQLSLLDRYDMDSYSYGQIFTGFYIHAHCRIFAEDTQVNLVHCGVSAASPLFLGPPWATGLQAASGHLSHPLTNGRKDQKHGALLQTGWRKFLHRCYNPSFTSFPLLPVFPGTSALHAEFRDSRAF